MIAISTIDAFGYVGALKGMRNPKNSWDRSDSKVCNDVVFIGENDMKLATALVNAGSEHRKFLRMIHVQVDVLAPLYWWKEMDTYKVGTTCNSCSTMHKIQAKEFTLDDFSREHLGTDAENILLSTIGILNKNRIEFINTKNKHYWWQMIQLLPTSYNQLRTLDMDYETLLRIYEQRKVHKLDEWHAFCDWIRQLTYMEEFIKAFESSALTD